MLAKTYEGVFTYFYIEVVTLDGITIPLIFTQAITKILLIAKGVKLVMKGI
jgi:hypothetical protein